MADIDAVMARLRATADALKPAAAPIQVVPPPADLSETQARFRATVASLEKAATRGPRGEAGPRGPEGPIGETGAMPDHRWLGTQLQFMKPDGSWGELVNLLGPRGARGGGGGGMVTVVPAPAPPSGDAQPGEPTFVDFPAAMALGGNRAVRLLAGEAIYADNAVVEDANIVLGITQGAIAAGGLARIQSGGLMTEPSWAWTVAAPVFVGSSGVLVQPSPTSGFSLIVGVATSPTQILIGARTPLVLL